MSSPANRSFAMVGWALLVVTLALYGKSIGYEFLLWDDYYYVRSNFYVLQGLTWEGSWRAWMETGHYFMPLSRISFMLNVDLTGTDPWGFHLINIILHALNGWLVLLWLQRATGQFWPAALTAAAFMVHPQHVEAVVWISERKELLAATCGLMALLAYTRHVNPEIALAKRRVAYLGSILLFLASLLAKPSWVTLPLLLLLLDFWPYRRQENHRRLLLEKIPYFLGSGLISMGTVSAYFTRNELLSLDHLPLSIRLGNWLLSLVVYVGQTLIPIGLSPLYPHPGKGLSVGLATLAGLTILASSLIAWGQRRRLPWLTVGWFWFVIALIPMAGFITGGVQVARTDRWTYFPHLGLFIGLAWSMAAIYQQQMPSRRWPVALAVALLLGWSLVTWRQIDYWRNTETLWQRAIAVEFANPHAHFGLGLTYLEREDGAQALPHLQEAVQQEPNNATYRAALGDAWLTLNNREEAANAYRAILGSSELSVPFLVSAGYVMLMNQLTEVAMALLDRAIALPGANQQRDYFKAHFLRGLVLLASGNPTAGRQLLATALTTHVGGLAHACQNTLDWFRASPKIPSLFPDAHDEVAKQCHLLIPTP